MYIWPVPHRNRSMYVSINIHMYIHVYVCVSFQRVEVAKLLQHVLLTGLSYLPCQDHFVYNSLHQGEGKVAAVEGKYRNEYVFILYVCYYYLYFCTEGNRFRAVYGYKSTKCSSHRQPLGVQNNCPYNLYAYSASCNIYNYIIYIHKYVIHTYKSHMPHTGTHTRTHARTHARTYTHTILERADTSVSHRMHWSSSP